MQHLEYRTGCLTPSVAFLTGDHKSGLTAHRASYILAMCGKFTGADTDRRGCRVNRILSDIST